MHSITTSPKSGSLVLALTHLLDVTGSEPAPAKTVYLVASFHGVTQERLQAAYDRAVAQMAAGEVTARNVNIDRACEGL